MELDPRQTLIIAILVLYLGRFINNRAKLLREYNIPEPVTGGLLASVLFGMLYWIGDIEVNFDMANRNMLLVVFFTTIGLSSRIDVLKEFYDEQSKVFKDDPKRADELLSVGESPRDEKLDPYDHAAWTLLASIILNLDETLNRE